MNKAVDAIDALQAGRARALEKRKIEQQVRENAWRAKKAAAQHDFLLRLDALGGRLDNEILTAIEKSRFNIVIWRKTFWRWRRSRSCLAPVLAEIVRKPPNWMRYSEKEKSRRWIDPQWYDLDEVFESFVRDRYHSRVEVIGDAGELWLRWDPYPKEAAVTVH